VAIAADTGSELLYRIRWYVWLRWFLLLAVIVPTLISVYLGKDLFLTTLRGIELAATLLGANAVFFGLSRLKLGRTYYRWLGIGLLAFDIVFITFYLHIGGAIESRMVLLYAVPILMASPFFGRRGVYIAAASSALFYDLLLLANYYDWIKSPNALTHLGDKGSYVLYSITMLTTVLLIIAVATDFLTRLLIQKEKEASAAVEALQRAQAIAHVGSWEWDVASDKITWSDELYRIFGVPPTASLNFETYIDHIHPRDRARVAKAIQQAVKARRGYSLHHRVVLPNKLVRVVHGEGKLITDKRGKVVRMYGTGQDVTAERALEAAKGDFVALASHQLRTPASGVRMLLAMLRDGYTDPLTPAQLKMVEEAYAANERMLRISDDLLNVAKLESGRLVLNKRQMELRLWLTNVTAPHILLAREHHQKLRLEIPKGTWNVQADPERLAMVLDNLLSNARKYTPPRGTIRVALESKARNYKITVSDTGSGMTRAEIANLFGKFTRLDNAASRGAEGTGLGLYLAKSIMDLHRGSIKVTSHPGTGSTFAISLPRTARAS
jgi:signal transduction histidine kinase